MGTTIASTPRKSRLSAGERRHEILEAAVAEFAIKGLHGTSTEAIARHAGVSQPYIFRLFGSKKDLFLATVARGFDRIEEAFRLAIAADPDLPLQSMGLAYNRLLAHREELLLQMQSYAACSDPDVLQLVQKRYGDLYRYVSDVSGATDDEVRMFFAKGMLMNVAAAIDLSDLGNREDWARACLEVSR
jgi:AcrR family transcriptional regulator